MPSDIDISAKTEVLLEALPYFQRFAGSTFVVKFGGSFMDTDDARRRVATDLVFLAAVGIRVVVVHGGGKAITRAMQDAKLEAVFRNGMRVTDAATVAIVEKTLNHEINADICDHINALGGKASQVFGQSVLQCQKLMLDDNGTPVDIGFVGDVTGVDATAIEQQLQLGAIPVVSPVGSDASGQFYNTNADVAAAHIAVALQARRLVFLCDVPGLLKDPKDPSTLISTLPVAEVAPLKSTGVISSGMQPKVDSAAKAITNGVHRVHFIDGRLPHSILLEIFTDKGIGTEIVQH
ncbi:MAG: acetylglutamate kinase [Verrucomicrobia bacterium]|nr:acetylglutamate kinase [Verrucomicrobiota bacterium]